MACAKVLGPDTETVENKRRNTVLLSDGIKSELLEKDARGIKTESSGLCASVSVPEQKQFGFKPPQPRKPQWDSGRTRTLALSPSAFCFVEVFLGCFWMKISLPGISFLTSGVWQEERAAASQPRSPGQSHSCTARGPMGPAWRTARPQIVKQTEEEKIQRKKKKRKQKSKQKQQTKAEIPNGEGT